MENTLWHGNTTDLDGAGTINHSSDHTGNPAFVDPNAGDYHITEHSAAKDAGVDAGVTTDMEGQTRPYDSSYEIGADEFHYTHIRYLPLILRSTP
jgi:hypothetical protein